jgi:hypothetical protein
VPEYSRKCPKMPDSNRNSVTIHSSPPPLHPVKDSPLHALLPLPLFFVPASRLRAFVTPPIFQSPITQSSIPHAPCLFPSHPLLFTHL